MLKIVSNTNANSVLQLSSKLAFKLLLKPREECFQLGINILELSIDFRLDLCKLFTKLLRFLRYFRQSMSFSDTSNRSICSLISLHSLHSFSLLSSVICKDSPDFVQFFAQSGSDPSLDTRNFVLTSGTMSPGPGQHRSRGQGLSLLQLALEAVHLAGSCTAELSKDAPQLGHF